MRSDKSIDDFLIRDVINCGIQNVVGFVDLFNQPRGGSIIWGEECFYEGPAWCKRCAHKKCYEQQGLCDIHCS